MTVEIDPIEAIIEHADADAGLTALIGTQVASKHKFGSKETDWTLPSQALTIRSDGGTPDIYTARQLLRLEARCYGASQPEAMAVYLALVSLTRSVDREVVTVTGGGGLVYWLLISSGPSLLYDTDINIDYVLTFLEAAVHEIAVS